MSYIHNYSSCKSTYATLRVYPKKGHPDEITKLLGIKPTDISLAGPGSLGRKRVNGWFLSTESKIKSRDSRRHIDWLLDKIEVASTKICKLKKSGAKIDIMCFWDSVSGNGGPLISPKQMKRLAALNLEVWWDVWFSGSAEEVQPTDPQR